MPSGKRTEGGTLHLIESAELAVPNDIYHDGIGIEFRGFPGLIALSRGDIPERLSSGGEKDAVASGQEAIP